MQTHKRCTAKNSAPVALQRIQYSIDILTAILLLTGQITTTGLFAVPEGFYFSATGPILGGSRLTENSLPSGSGIVLDIIDILLALLFIIGELHVTGPYVSSKRVFIVFSGYIFGLQDVPKAAYPRNPTSKELSQFLKHEMLSRVIETK